ncbi:MAG: DMT family protein [Lentisphaeria bacterium]|nr:DMT family protein [Lentisphaeria bacterium]
MNQIWQYITAPIVRVVFLLICSNVFMTFAWYGHLKNLANKPWYIAALVSWGIALFEYLLQVPANRLGHAGGVSLAQLKIMQEVITLSVFVPFAMLYMNESLRWNHIAAGVCLVLAVVFVFAFGK